jgi:hypothetical protein
MTSISANNVIRVPILLLPVLIGTFESFRNVEVAGFDNSLGLIH